jgi:hypothetical protein
MIRISIVFDEEDYITPAEHGLDDLLKTLADVMTEEKVSGTFFVIGERLRCLRERGRQDVLEAVAGHDIGSHTNMGSIHPTVTERMEQAGWADGMARMAADELAGIDEMEALLGKPVRSLARHGGSYCPQLLAALGRRALPYVYSPARLPGHNVTWFCSTLNFFECMTCFQEAYLSREAFLQTEQKFFEMLNACQGYDWAAVFNSHPCMIKTSEFWDLNYYRGANPPSGAWRVPEFRSGYDLNAVRDNWALHCRRLRENPSLKLGTIAEFAAEFGCQAEEAGAAELAHLARRAAESDAPFFTDRFSAAEILDLLARWYLARVGRTGVQRLARRNVLGPAQMPLAVPTARQLDASALARVARGLVVAVDTTGMLPSRVCCGEGPLGTAGEIGTGTALSTLGAALSADGFPGGAVPTRTVAPCVKEAEEIAARVRGFSNDWPCHRPDLDPSAICRLTLLQSWTLKPAWPGGVPTFE